MNVLMTGSSGFVGKHLRSILSKKHHIRSFSLLESSLDSLELNGMNAVVHLAALVHQMKGAAWEEYYRVNVLYPLELARKAKESGVNRFVFLSSVKVYGEHSVAPFTEESLCHPEDDYGRSKLLAEMELRKLQDESFSIRIIRVPLVYGAGVKGNMIQLLKLVDRWSILPFGCINNRRSMVYVENLCGWIQRVLESDEEGIFLVADPQPLSTSELVEHMATSLDKRCYNLCIPVMKPMLKCLKPKIYKRLFCNMEIDIRESRRRLNYQVPFNAEDGVLNMVEWYQKND